MKKLAQQAGSSRNQVQRYIRLTELIPELMDMVDEKKIALNPAYELSFLKKGGTGRPVGRDGQRTGYPFSLKPSGSKIQSGRGI